MELVHGTGSADEIQTLLLNVTENMEAIYNQTEVEFLRDRLSYMLDAIRGLQTTVDSVISEGATDEEVRSTVSSQLEGLFAERPGRPTG